MDPVEEQLYAIAGQEVSSRNMSPGLMAKALADADGDERKAAAAYIRMRVEQLRAEQAAKATESAVREKQRRKLEEEDGERKLRARHTKCPKCGFVGKMTHTFWSLVMESFACFCPKCGHGFTWYHFKG